MDTKWGVDLKGGERDGEFGQNTMHKILRELSNKIVVIMDVLEVAQCDICLHIFYTHVAIWISSSVKHSFKLEPTFKIRLFFFSVY